MRTLIISDTHLTHRFEPAKYEKLQKLISAADRVILNGDFWDYYLSSWEEFLASPWKALFPLLKERQTIYIYGNHDLEKYSDERVNLFSVQQTEQYDLHNDGQSLHIEHGHRLVPTLEERLPLLKRRWVVQIGQKVEAGTVRVLGKNYFRLTQSFNTAVKKSQRQHVPSDAILVCGHTHVAEFNLAQHFINSGFNRYGYVQAVMISDDKFEVIDERYIC